MSIRFLQETKSFRLDTPKATYLFHIHEGNYLIHDYYGATVGEDDLRYLCARGKRNGTYPNSPDVNNREFSPALAPMEYSTNGSGDFRISALQIRDGGGHNSTDLRYVSHKIYKGKPAIPHQPATYATAEEADTLEVFCKDPATDIEITLFYTVFRKADVITRHTMVVNNTACAVDLERIASTCLDFVDADYRLLHLDGSWSRECTVEREALTRCIKTVSSKRGYAGHQHNPFVALVRSETTEDQGEAYGISLIYSGNFASETQVDAFYTTRMLMGINPEGFGWRLDVGETFYTPEAVMVYSNEGLGEMSRTYHKLYRHNLCRGPWKTKKRPILINNWEATRFTFDGNKIYSIAEEASKLGIEMMVMDDGWFGTRDDDKHGLGDWYVNEKKLNGPLKDLVDRIHGLGMKFGIWFEPEMVNPLSDLYEAHPDWCLKVDGRTMSTSRNQYVLDMSREDVRDYLLDCMAKIMDSCQIDYIKWDFNRPLTEVGSALLPAERQKEVFHRFVLGLYDLLERLLDRYPNLLLEGCASGGGRYDPAMLYYSPQYWASDETDAMERLPIQFGSSMCYPASSMGAHVSRCPSHHMKRTTPFETRGNVALWGTFGYELDITKLTDEEKELVKVQCEEYHKYFNVIHNGDLYRLIPPYTREEAAWMFVSPDKKEALVTVVVMMTKLHRNRYIKLRGLDPKKNYKDEETGKIYNGKTLMNAGLIFPEYREDFTSFKIHLTEI